jgi:hypothetical protein
MTLFRSDNTALKTMATNQPSSLATNTNGVSRNVIPTAAAPIEWKPKFHRVIVRALRKIPINRLATTVLPLNISVILPILAVVLKASFAIMFMLWYRDLPLLIAKNFGGAIAMLWSAYQSGASGSHNDRANTSIPPAAKHLDASGRTSWLYAGPSNALIRSNSRKFGRLRLLRRIIIR